MRTNSDLTIYNKYIDSSTRSERYQKTAILGVEWENKKGSNAIRSGGMAAANQATIFIPFPGHLDTYLEPIAWVSSKSGRWTLQIGDIVVRGNVSDEIHPAVVSPPEAAFTATDLKGKYDDVFVISSVDSMDMGSMSLRHWKVGVQ